MENNFKSREINLLSQHPNLTNENVNDVWIVNITNVINEKEQSKLEQLEQYAKSMKEKKAHFDNELYQQIKQRLKIESNQALKVFNKPTTNKRKRRARRNTRRRS
jgi:hypothetical protein